MQASGGREQGCRHHPKSCKMTPKNDLAPDEKGAIALCGPPVPLGSECNEWQLARFAEEETVA